MQIFDSSKFQFISLINKAESLLSILKINSFCLDHADNLIEYICLCKIFMCKECLLSHSKNCSSPKFYSVSFLIEKFKNELYELKFNSLLLLKKDNLVSSKFYGYIFNLEKNLKLFVLFSLKNIVDNKRSINSESVSSLEPEKEFISRECEFLKNESLENYLLTEICNNKIINRETNGSSNKDKHEIKKAKKFNKRFCKLNKLLLQLLKNKTKISWLTNDTSIHEFEHLKYWIQINYAKDNYLTEFFSNGFSFKNLLIEDSWVALIFVFLKNEIFAKFYKELFEYNYEKKKEIENQHIKNLMNIQEISGYKQHKEIEIIKEVPELQIPIDIKFNLETNNSFSPILKISISTEKDNHANYNMSEIFNSEDKENNSNYLEKIPLNLKNNNYNHNPDFTNEATKKITLIIPEVETVKKIKEMATTFNQDKSNNEEKFKQEKFEEIKNNLKLISQHKKFQSFTSLSSRKHFEKDQVLNNNSSSNPSLDACINNSENILVKIESNLDKFQNKNMLVAENFEVNKNKVNLTCDNDSYENTNNEKENIENKIQNITNENFSLQENLIESISTKKNGIDNISSRDSTPGRKVDFFCSSNSLIGEYGKKTNNIICQKNKKVKENNNEIGENFPDNLSESCISDNKENKQKTQNEVNSFTDSNEESNENKYNKNSDIFNVSFMKKFEKFKNQYFPLDASKDFKNSFFINDKINTKKKSSMKVSNDIQINKAKKINKINSNELENNKEEFINVRSTKKNRITNKNLDEILKNKNEKINPLDVSINLQTLNSKGNNGEYEHKFVNQTNHIKTDKIKIIYSNESNPRKNSNTKIKNYKNCKKNIQKNKNFNFNLDLIQNKNKNYAKGLSQSSSVSKSKDKNQIEQYNKDSLKNIQDKKEIINFSQTDFRTKKKIDLDTHIVHLVDDSDDSTENEILLENLAHKRKEICTINNQINFKKSQIKENSSQHCDNNINSKISEQKNIHTITNFKENSAILNDQYNNKLFDEKIKHSTENTKILECKQENKENFNPNKIEKKQNKFNVKENIENFKSTENNFGNKLSNITNLEKQSKNDESEIIAEITDCLGKICCEEKDTLDSAKEEFNKIFNTLLKSNNFYNQKSSIGNNELLTLAKKAFSLLPHSKDSKFTSNPKFKNQILEELLIFQSKYNIKNIIPNSKSSSEYNVLFSNFEDKNFNNYKGNLIKYQKDTEIKSENKRESQSFESQKSQEKLRFGNSLIDNSDKFSQKNNKNPEQNILLQNLKRKCNLDLYKKDIEREEEILICVDCGEYFSIIPGASVWRKRCIECFSIK